MWCAIFCGAYDNKAKTERTSWFFYGLGLRFKTRALPENKVVVEHGTVECLFPLCCAYATESNNDDVRKSEQVLCTPLCCFYKDVKEDIPKNRRIIDQGCFCIPCGSNGTFNVEPLSNPKEEL